MTIEDPEMTDDMELVREFARQNSNEVFAALVSRHINLVYSVAIRQVRDPHLAEEVTQAVFVILARKAASLGPKTILSGWLCRTARNVGANALTIQRRRQRREQEAYVQSLCNEPEPDIWGQIAPLLDAAMSQLGEKDHDAVVLRFFDGKDLKDVGAALGVSEEAAKKRVTRAVEKLRVFFHKRGVLVPVTILAAAISANAVQAAPAGLVAIAVSTVSGGTTLTLIKAMAWTKFKYSVIAGLLVAGLATTIVVIKRQPAKAVAQAEPGPGFSLPNPNGYTYFVKAAQMLMADFAASVDQMSEAGLRALVAQNSGALQLARQGFHCESRVADNNAPDMLKILESIKRLALAFSAEGRLAAMENRSDDAVRIHLETVRLGQESSRGGTLMVRLVGIAIEKIGLDSLQPLEQGTDARQCKEIALALESLDAREPTISETLACEKAFADKLRAAEPIMRRMMYAITQPLQARMMAPAIQQATNKIQAHQAVLRQAMIAFAARAYELEKNQRPASLRDLTPDYLKAIPQDPRTGKDIVYPR